MRFSFTSDRDEQFLIDRGADPDEVYRWRLACEIRIYKSLQEARQAGLKLIEKEKD